MKRLGFKYLHKYRIAVLALILTLTSTLFTVTALSLLGFYNGFNAYLGEGRDIVVIYDRGSSTPFTGLVPVYLVENLSLANGVLAYSLEVIAPCIVNGYSTFIRGVVPKEFSKLTSLTMVYGEELKLNDIGSIVVGWSIARKLQLDLGDKVMVLGVLNNRYLELTVKGIYVSHSPLDDEILAPLYVGQWLRGVDYSLATLIRVKVDRSRLDRLLEGVARDTYKLGREATPKILPATHVFFKHELIGVKEAYNFMKSYLDRYGLTREVIVVIAAIVFMLTSVCVLNALTAFIHQHEYEVEVLRALGISRRVLKLDLLAKFLPLSIISSIAGFLIGTLTLIAASSYGYLQLLLHTVTLQFNPLVLALSILLTATLTIIGIISLELK